MQHDSNFFEGYLGEAPMVELDEERTKWSTLHICINENINKMSWDTIECPKTPSNYQNFIDFPIIIKNKEPNTRGKYLAISGL